MTVAAPAPVTPQPAGPSRLVRAWLLTAVSDGFFSSSLNVFAYGSTVTRLWQGVASTLLGKAAIDGGLQPAAIGLAMHFGVALGWSTVLFVATSRWRWLGEQLASPYGVLKVAAFYGPCVWMVMSLVVIPVLLQRPPSITMRWWVQFFGHIPFVAVPIAWGIRGTPSR